MQRRKRKREQSLNVKEEERREEKGREERGRIERKGKIGEVEGNDDRQAGKRGWGGAAGLAMTGGFFVRLGPQKLQPQKRLKSATKAP